MFKKVFYILFVIFLIELNTVCMANQNVIDSIVLSQSKQNANSYELNVTSNKNLIYRINSNTNSKNIEFKNAILSEDAAVSYDNASDIQSVILRQNTKNSVQIQITGQNINNIAVSFTKSNLNNAKFNTKSDININPIIIMFLSMICIFALVIKALTSKIEISPDNLEIVRNITNTNTLKITAKEYKKSIANYNKTKTSAQKNKYTTTNKKTTKRELSKVKNPVKL